MAPSTAPTTPSWQNPAKPPHLRKAPGTKGLPDYIDLSRESIEGYNDVRDYFREGAWNIEFRDHQDPQVRNLADADAVAGIRMGERAKAKAIAAGGEGARARGDMMALAGAQQGYQTGQERALEFRKYLTGQDERNAARRLEGAQQLFDNDMQRRMFNEEALSAHIDRKAKLDTLQMQKEQMANQQLMQLTALVAANPGNQQLLSMLNQLRQKMGLPQVPTGGLRPA